MSIPVVFLSTAARGVHHRLIVSIYLVIIYVPILILCEQATSMYVYISTNRII